MRIAESEAPLSTVKAEMKQQNLQPAPGQGGAGARSHYSGGAEPRIGKRHVSARRSPRPTSARRWRCWLGLPTSRGTFATEPPESGWQPPTPAAAKGLDEAV
jgi:hypothetical protein